MKKQRIGKKFKSWKIGDYLRQFSVVAAGIIVTFWGNDLLTERSRQKQLNQMMHYIKEELMSFTDIVLSI